MLNEIEEGLLNRLTEGLASIFRTTWSFLPTDAVASFGTYLRELATRPREVQTLATAISAGTILASAAVNVAPDPGSFDNIEMEAAVASRLKLSGRQWTLICKDAITWTATGNVAVAGACPANTSVTFTYVPADNKWYPSKIA